jgi:hypothetical protein
MIVVGLLVIAVLAGAFFYVWKHQPKQTQANDATSGTSTTQSSTQTSTTTPPKDTINLAKLPLGDGKVSTTPKVGYVDSCTTNFKGGGARHAGSWIKGDTWDADAKPTVQGSVYWSSAKMSITLSGSTRTISGNGLPIKLPTGIFPIQANTTAYQYDTNPNHIQSQQVFYQLSANPAFASTPSCVPMGVIGYLTDGVALFNALDAAGRDAAAHEIQDKCDGHPQSAGIYHYHSMSVCIKAEDENSTLVGYAMDGYGIFSDRDANGKQYTTADLDACHGITSEIMWNGKKVNMYHYVLTHDYPYTISCFRGTPVRTGGAQPRP